MPSAPCCWWLVRRPIRCRHSASSPRAYACQGIPSNRAFGLLPWEAGLAADRVEVGVSAGGLRPLRLAFGRLPQVQERVEVTAASRLHAGEVVEERGLARSLGERLDVDPDR